MDINVILDDTNDRKTSKINIAKLFFLDLSHCYQQKSEKNKRSLSAIYALVCTAPTS